MQRECLQREISPVRVPRAKVRGLGPSACAIGDPVPVRPGGLHHLTAACASPLASVSMCLRQTTVHVRYCCHCVAGPADRIVTNNYVTPILPVVKSLGPIDREVSDGPTDTHTALPCSVALPASTSAREILKDIQQIVPIFYENPAESLPLLFSLISRGC